MKGFRAIVVAYVGRLARAVRGQGLSVASLVPRLFGVACISIRMYLVCIRCATNDNDVKAVWWS